MDINPGDWLSHGLLGGICLIFFLTMSAGLLVINGIRKDGNSRDSRLIDILVKNADANTAVAQRMAEMNTRVEDVQDSIRRSLKNGTGG